MPNIVPSDIFYAQAAELVDTIVDAQGRDTLELSRQLNEILARFDEMFGGPISSYEPLVESEPLSSDKTNRFLTGVEADIRLLKRQIDLLRAASVFTYNTASTEIGSLKDVNSRIENRVRSLQMHSASRHDDVIVFTDTFKNRDLIDDNLVSANERALISAPGYLTLPSKGYDISLSSEAEVNIMPISNGFIGNNQEIENPASAPIDPVTNSRSYSFVQESYPANDIASIQDSQPSTWIEYERYGLSPQQVDGAGSYNFIYSQEMEDGSVRMVDWSTPPDDGVLTLGLEFDFKRSKHINSISIIPFGLEDDKNYPILIKSIYTSETGTDWQEVSPSHVWIANDINLQTARISSSAVVGGAVWNFRSRSARYVRIVIEQHNPVDCNIGYLYWVHKDYESFMLAGPTPPIDDTGKHFSDKSIGDGIQRRSFLQGKRWAIGLRDIEISQTSYAEKAVIVTKSMSVNGIIDRVALESVDLSVPDNYPTDHHWVRFYVSPDDGRSWYQIARMDHPERGITQQITFNNPLHESLRELAVVNYSTEKPVSSLRLKVEMERPADLESTTPILRSYTLKVLKR